MGNFVFGILRQRSFDERDESEIDDAQDQSADIFKLDIDCFEEIFDKLPLKDLISIGKTCKRLRKVAGHYFHRNYPGVRVVSDSSGVGIHTNAGYANVNHFAEFVRKIVISDGNGLQFISNMQSKFRRIKRIEIHYMRLTWVEISGMTKILSKVEVVRLKSCNLKGHFKKFIAHCSNLKRLKIEHYDADYDELIQKYPTVEYFQLTPRITNYVKGFAKILTLNSNIRKFTARIEFLWENRDLIKNSAVKLDDLAILFYDYYTDVGPFCRMINEFFECGVYRRLQLYFWEISNQEMIDRTMMVHGLVKVYAYDIKNHISIPSLKNLEEVCLYMSSAMANLEVTPDDLVHLKRMHFVSGSLDHVVGMVKQATALEKIKFVQLRNGTYFNEDTNVVDLPALNQLRAQLPNARKITLYVGEKVYLNTKWTLIETDFPLIRLKRCDSFQWNHDFGFDY